MWEKKTFFRLFIYKIIQKLPRISMLIKITKLFDCKAAEN